jgi:flagellar protein FlaG
MNTINQASMVHAAMDGQSLYANAAAVKSNTASQYLVQTTPTGAQVAQNIEQNIAELKANSQELQKLSEMVGNRELQFNVDKELGSVVVKVIDTRTNQVLKEIPSEDIQKLN